MSKGKGQRMRMTRAPGQGDMMAQIQKLQKEMMATQEALGDETVTITAGGGAVTVVMTGHQHVESIKLDPEAVDPNDVEMLQDLIVAAVNEAIERSQALAAERLGVLTGGLGGLGGMGGLGGLLG